MRVALYVRVSTDEQVKAFSIDEQKERLIAFCASQGWDQYQLYIDDGYTGTNLDRPALNRLIRHIEEKKIDVVIVYKLDRLSRKQLDVLYLLEKVFDAKGVAFKSATEPFDTTTPLGKAMIGMLAVFAQLERDMIVERTTSGRRQRVSQGKWYGGPVPFGYRWNQEAQMLEIVPDEARIVQEIYRKYLNGESRLSIAEWAQKRTKARTFDSAVIRDMLSRPIYIGKLVNSQTIVDGNHQPIIDDETWYTAQKELKRRKEGMPPVGDYLLTGLLECGVCGANIVHVKRTTKPNGKAYSYELYACRNQHVRTKERNNYCNLGYTRREKIEKYVIGQIEDIALNPHKLHEMMESETSESKDEVIDALRDKLKSIDAGLENLYDAIQSGTVKASAVGSRISKLEEEREAIERQLDDLIENTPQYVEPEKTILLIQQIGDAWDYFTFEEKKILIRKIIRKIILYKDEDPLIIWNTVE